MRAKLLKSGAQIPQDKRNRYLKEPGMTEEKLDRLLSWDPSPKGQFMPWIIKWERAGKINESVKAQLVEYMRLCNNKEWRRDDRNFGSWTPEKLEQAVGIKERHKRQQMSKTELERKIMTDGVPGARLILNDGTWKVWRVTSIPYEIFLSSNTKWCTTQEIHAETYLTRGPLFPIYKNDKPFAQGNIGSDNPGSSMPTGQYVLLDRNDQKLKLTQDTLDMFAAIKALPEHRYFERFLWSTLTELPEDPRLLSKVQDFIVENDDARLLEVYLSEHFWAEGWELLFDLGSTKAVNRLIQAQGPDEIDQLVQHGFAKDLAQTISAAEPMLFPIYLAAGEFKKFFTSCSGQVQVPDTMNKEDQRAFLDYAKQVYTSERKILDLRPDDVSIGQIFAPLWASMMAPNNFYVGALHKALMAWDSKYPTAYNKMLKAEPKCTLKTLPKSLEVGDRVKLGPSFVPTSNIEKDQEGIVTAASGDRYGINFDQSHNKRVLYNPSAYTCEVVPIGCDYTYENRKENMKELLLDNLELRESLPRRLAVGQKVKNGPDYTGEPFSGVVSEVDGPNYKVALEGGETLELTYFPLSKFELIPDGDLIEPTVKLNAPAPPFAELQVGMVLARDNKPEIRCKITKLSERELTRIWLQGDPNGTQYGRPVLSAREWDKEISKRYILIEMTAPKEGRGAPVNPFLSEAILTGHEPLPSRTRVKRGPNWQWGNQDDRGEGTVEYYNENPRILRNGSWQRVRWDNGYVDTYEFFEGNFGIIPVGYDDYYAKAQQ